MANFFNYHRECEKPATLFLSDVPCPNWNYQFETLEDAVKQLMISGYWSVIRDSNFELVVSLDKSLNLIYHTSKSKTTNKMENLTPRQKEIFEKIKVRIEKTGYFTTNSDSDVFFVFGQKCVSHRIISLLIKKGYLKLWHSNPYKGYKYVLSTPLNIETNTMIYGQNSVKKQANGTKF